MKTFKIGDRRAWTGALEALKKDHPAPIRIGDVIYDDLQHWYPNKAMSVFEDWELLSVKYQWTEELCEGDNGHVYWKLVGLEELPPPQPETEEPKKPGFFSRLFRRNQIPLAKVVK